MSKAKLVYILSLRNAAADKAGQHVAYKGAQRYMTSPLEYLARALDETPLGDAYSLEGIVIDDDPRSPRDQAIKARSSACASSRSVLARRARRSTCSEVGSMTWLAIPSASSTRCSQNPSRPAS